MAYYNQETEDENETAQGMNSIAAPTTGNSPIQTTQQSSTVGSGPASAPSAPKSAKPASSGSAPGFQNYAKANQGKAQESLNSAAAQAVSNSGQAATNAINQATQSFGKKVDQGTLENMGTAVQDVKGTVDSARNLTAGAGVDQSQQDRFKQVINAQYQGPESLRQAGLYNPASQKAQAAQTISDNTKTATGREELLKNMYQQRGDYSSGLNKLDSALLNASKTGVQTLQDTAKAQGNLGQKLDQAQIGSANTAQNRTNEIKDVRQQARTAFSEGKTAEEAATEARLDEMLVTPVKDANGKVVMKPDGKPMTMWDQLPESFRDVIRNKEATNKAMLGSEIDKFKQSTNYNKLGAQTAQAQAEVEAATRALRDSYKISNRGNVSSINLGSPVYNEKTIAAQKALEAAQAKLAGINKNRTNLESQLSKLQTTYNPNAVNFNSLEAATLGINSGEGLYNLGENAIVTGQAERDRLVSKDEQARQAALASLAGLDMSKVLDTNLRYDNADRAGTQSIMDSLDLGKTRQKLNAAEKNFQNYAENADITGTGSKKNKSSGKRYYANESANIGDLLQNSGYEFGQDPRAATGNADVLKNINNVANLNESGGELSIYDKLGLSGVADLASMNSGQSAAGTLIDANPMMYGANAIMGALGGKTVGNVVSGLFGGASSSKESKSIAAQQARADLQNKIQQGLDSQGFQNRANVVDNDQTKQRATALQQLLANLDKTNVG